MVSETQWLYSHICSLEEACLITSPRAMLPEPEGQSTWLHLSMPIQGGPRRGWKCRAAHDPRKQTWGAKRFLGRKYNLEKINLGLQQPKGERQGKMEQKRIQNPRADKPVIPQFSCGTGAWHRHHLLPSPENTGSLGVRLSSTRDL